MIKWVLGCLGLIVVAVVCVVWFGYRKLRTFADQPPVSTAMIAAPPSRVFATVASADSMTTWMMKGTEVTSKRHGLLSPGDTVMIVGAMNDTLTHRTMWIVTAVVPDKLIAMETRRENTQQVGIQRRDSITAIGDSTQLVSTFAATAMDSVLKEQVKSAAGKAVMEMGAKLILSAMRLQGDGELQRIKDRLEGRITPSDSVVKPPG